MRSDHSLFKIGPFSNGKLNLAALSSIVLVGMVLFVPFLRTAFELVLLPTWLYGVAVGLIFVPLVVMETMKLIERLIDKKKNK